MILRDVSDEEKRATRRLALDKLIAVAFSMLCAFSATALLRVMGVDEFVQGLTYGAIFMWLYQEMRPR